MRDILVSLEEEMIHPQYFQWALNCFKCMKTVLKSKYEIEHFCMQEMYPMTIFIPKFTCVNFEYNCFHCQSTSYWHQQQMHSKVLPVMLILMLLVVLWWCLCSWWHWDQLWLQCWCMCQKSFCRKNETFNFQLSFGSAS